MSTEPCVDPCAILLTYAHRSEHIDYDEMVSWAADLGLERSDLLGAYGEDGSQAESFIRRGERRSARAATPQPPDTLRMVLATAYAHGRLELDDLFRWAEELGLDRDEVVAVMRLAADLASGPARRRPYGLGLVG
jgi:hypothetical protein